MGAATRLNRFLTGRAQHFCMLRTMLLVLVFLSAADIVMYDSTYSTAAGRMTAHIWTQFSGR